MFTGIIQWSGIKVKFRSSTSLWEISATIGKHERRQDVADIRGPDRHRVRKMSARAGRRELSMPYNSWAARKTD